MRRSLRLLVALALLAAPLSAAASTGCGSAETAATTTHHTFSSFDGTELAVTLFKPTGVCAAAPAPAILDFHGWGGSRAKQPDGEIQAFLNAGYGVVSMDARGHGESGGTALVMHPTREVADMKALLDWLYDSAPWVRRELSGIPKDLVLGGNGASYGGAAQLMLAAHDGRLDAMAPGRTWNDLRRDLFPNEVVEKVWASLLTAGAARSGTTVDPTLTGWTAEAVATDAWSADALDSMVASSPATWIDGIEVPTLLVQGMNDTLFDLDEAMRTAGALASAGVPVKVFGIQTGHALPTQPTGVNGPKPSMGPCWGGTAVKLTLYDAFLEGDPNARARFDAMPFVTIPTEEGACLSGSSWPMTTSTVTADLGPTAVPPGAGSVLVPVLGPNEPAVIAGSPRLSLHVGGQAGQALFASLVLVNGRTTHVVYDQVTPFRLGTALQSRIEVDLAPVAADIGPGERLFLRLESANDQFAGVRSTPVPALIVSGSLTLPTL